MFNKVILIGNLTKDPELRYTPQGTPVCTLRIASTTRFKSGDSMKDETLFINVVVWGKQGETVAQHLSKDVQSLSRADCRSGAGRPTVSRSRGSRLLLRESVSSAAEKKREPRTKLLPQKIFRPLMRRRTLSRSNEN